MTLDLCSFSQYGILGSYANFMARLEPECNIMGYDKCFILKPEYTVNIAGKRYRLDFFQPQTKIAVEIDGRKWHSTNKQIQYDYERERDLIANSFTVLRFTATEAIEKPMLCLIQIYSLYCRLNVERGIDGQYLD